MDNPRIFQSDDIEDIFLDRIGREVLSINEENFVVPKCEQSGKMSDELLQPTKAQTRGDVLLSAHKTINGKRQDVYGRAENNFETIGLIWQVIDQYKPDDLSNAANVALKMMGMKLARIISNPTDLDSIRDLCGYAGLFADITKAKDKEKD